jgi:hypothetical protein
MSREGFGLVDKAEGISNRRTAMRKVPGIFAVGLAMMVSFSLFGGCASFPPPEDDIPNSRTYGNSYNDVWDAVLGSLSEMNIQVKSMEKESGEIVAEDGTVELRQFELGRYDSKYCFCGSPKQFNFLRELVGEYTISVTRGTGVRVLVKIEASYRASQYSGESLVEWLPCPSKGIFEPIFLKHVESRLGAVISPSRKLYWWQPSRGY